MEFSMGLKKNKNEKWNKNKNKKREKSQDYIEMQDKGDTGTIHMTTEENRKIIPREFKNLLYIINKNSDIKKYSWEIEGEKIITKKKLYFSKEEKKIIKFLLLKKMPERYRQDFWLIASGARSEMQNNPDYYNNLVENYPEYIPSPYEHQIHMDLHRTFPGDPFFLKEENVKKLKNILVAYSRRNLSIGYCQGFNFIAARLLKIFPLEEEAFWIFVQLIENILPINYYSELAGIMVDCAILLKLIKIYLPSLHNHLVEVGYEMSLNNVLYKWFVSIFIQNLSIDLSLIIWDLLFLEGNMILFKSALGVLKIIKNAVLSKNNMEDINTVFDEGTKHLNDHYTLIYYIVFRKFDFDYELICKHRIHYQSSIMVNIEKTNNHRKNKYLEEEANFNKNNKDLNKSFRRKASYVKNVVECFREWPLCIYDWSYKYNVVTHLVFRVHDPPNFIGDYFFDQIHEKEYVHVKNNSKYSKLHSSRKYSKSSDKINCNFNNNTKITQGLNFISDYMDSSISDGNNVIKGNSGNNYSFKNDEELLEDYEKKIKIYKNLLIERRPHFCPEKEKEGTKVNLSEHEVFVNQGFEISDSYVKLGNESEKKENKTKDEYKLTTACSSSKKKRSQSMIKSSFIKFPTTNLEDNYKKILCDLNSKDDVQFFETFKAKPFLETEEDF